MEQLTIFQVFQEQKFSWDPDINFIYDSLKKLFNKYNFKIKKAGFEVWEHYPQGGYRLDLTLEINEKFLSDGFQNQFNNIISWAKKHNIELGAYGAHKFNNDKKGRVFIFSRFLDKRKKRR